MFKSFQPHQARNNQGIVLFIVLGTIFIVIILGNIILSIISSQSRLTHHQVSRIQAYYAAQAGMVYTLEKLRTGDWTPNDSGGANKYACLNGCVDPGTAPTSALYVIPTDGDIPYNVQVTIHPKDVTTGIAQLDIKTEYTYTP